MKKDLEFELRIKIRGKMGRNKERQRKRRGVVRLRNGFCTRRRHRGKRGRIQERIRSIPEGNDLPDFNVVMDWEFCECCSIFKKNAYGTLSLVNKQLIMFLF